MSEEAHMLSPLSKKLLDAANVAINDVIKVKEGEKVLIVTNPELDVSTISKALFDASVEAGGETTILVQPTKSQLDFANGSVLGALRTDPDVLISISKEKLREASPSWVPVGVEVVEILSRTELVDPIRESLLPRISLPVSKSLATIHPSWSRPRKIPPPGPGL